LSFTGEFPRTIDAKGRLIIPSSMRDELESDKVVLVRWMNGCIGMFSGDGWRKLESDLLAQSRSSESARSVVRAVAASAHQDEVDRQGRITIPQSLRDGASITRDVVVTGALDHGEIWSPERWTEERSKVDDGRLEQAAAELNF
jgi:MraZ protein